MPTRRSPRLPLAAILLLLLASAVGCTGSSEPAATPTATLPVTSEPAATPTATLPVTSVGAATATATATRSNPIDISFGEHTLTEGPYRFSYSGTTTLFFDVPAGLRLNVVGLAHSDGMSSWGLELFVTLLLGAVDSKSWIGIDVHSGQEGGRWIDPARSDLLALFEELMRSVRISPPPTPTPDPVERLASRRLAVAAAPPRDISGWQFSNSNLNPGVYRFALNPHERPLIFEVPEGFEGISPKITFTGSMGDASDAWCSGLRLVHIRDTWWEGAWLCLDVYRAVELSRAFDAQSWDVRRLFDEVVESLRLGAAPSGDETSPCAPVIELPHVWAEYAVTLTGRTTYLWSLDTAGPPQFVTFDVPASVSLEFVFQSTRQADGSERYDELHLREASSGSRLTIDLATGREQGRELLEVPEPYDRDPGLAFDQILASLRSNELRTITGCPAPVVPSLGQTLEPGVYRYHLAPAGFYPAGVDIAFEVPAGLQLEVTVDDDPWNPYELWLTNVETNSWLCLDAELVIECGRSIKTGDERIEPLFDHVAASLRLGAAP